MKSCLGEGKWVRQPPSGVSEPQGPLQSKYGGYKVLGKYKHWQKSRKEPPISKDNIQLWGENGQQKERNEYAVKQETKKSKEKQMQSEKFECGKDRDDFLTEA